jgi:hypothetical protein
MYDLFSPKSGETAFVGYLIINDRYLSGGIKNPKFKIGKKQFMFSIDNSKKESKKQPIGNLLYLTSELDITTKFTDSHFKEGNYIEFEGKLYIIKYVNTDPGPNKAVYSWFNVNTLATTKMTIETAQE